MVPRRDTLTWTHPVLTQQAEERAKKVQNRIADAITRFAGSMTFVYLHVDWFGLWIPLRVEAFPFRVPGHARVPPGHLPVDVRVDQRESGRPQARVVRRASVAARAGRGKQNEELLTVSRQILDLTKQIHQTSGAKQTPS
jgi:hypothetical protein